jgi:lysophospholipase L1-like esterase
VAVTEDVLRRIRTIASLLCLATLLVASPTAAGAAVPPDNDDFASPIELTGESPAIHIDTTGATSEPGEATLYAGVGASVWFRWTAPTTGPTRIDTCDADFDSVLGVFTGASLATLSSVATDSGGCEPGSVVSFVAQAGETYRIAIAGWDGATGEVTLRVNAPPDNDAFAAAAVIDEVDGLRYEYGTNARATRETGEPDHAAGGGTHSVWYRWTASRSGMVTIDTCGYASFDTTLAVYTGTGLEALTPVAANDDAPGCLTSTNRSSVSFAAVAGTQYRIAVDGHGAGSGDFQLVLRGPPLNDAFADARDVSDVDGFYGTIGGATKEAGEPAHAGDAGGHSVWFTWLTSRSRSVTVSTCWAAFDTLLAVYTGASLEALTPVGIRSAAEDCEGGTQVTFTATAGTVYRIAVDGKAGASGEYELELPPANDDLAGALALDEENGFSFYGTTARATREPGEPEHGGGSGHSVWFSWNATTDQAVTLDTCGSDVPSVVAVYTGSAVNGLTPVAGSSSGAGFCAPGADGAGVSFAASAATSYRIAVDAGGATVGDFSITLSTAPANDAFAAAPALTGATINGSTRGATKETGEPDHAGNGGGHSVWYRWTATTSGPVSLEACGGSLGFAGDFDTLLAVYAGADVAALTPVASNDNGGASCFWNAKASAVSFVATAGTEYRIAIDGVDGAAGSFTLAFPPAPANDAFANAAALSGTFASATTITTGATKQLGEPDHAGDAGGHSVWYSWEAPSSGRYALDTCAGPFDTLLAVYTGPDVASLSQVAANDDAAACGPGSHGSLVTFSAGAGTTYRFAVDGKGGAAGTVGLALSTAPYNDDFASAITLSSVTSSTRGATRQPGEPEHASDPGGASVWYTFTAVESAPVTISTCPSGGFTTFDTVLAVYTGTSLGTLTPVASSDDSDSCGTGSTRSSVTFQATAGTQYRVALDGKGGAAGYASMEFVAKPANDDFAGAQMLLSDGSLALGSTRGGTREASEGAHAGDAASPTVWFRWTPSSSGPATIDTCTTASGASDTIVAVYTGTSLAAMTPVASNDDTVGCGNGRQSRVDFQAAAGTEYRIAVAGKDAGGPFYLRHAAVPGNDMFASPRLLSGTSAVSSGSNRFATTEAGEPEHAGHAGGRSVWFMWTAPASGLVTLDSCFSGFDTLLAVYTGTSLGALNPVAANDDAAVCGTGTGQSRATFTATAGTEYRFALDGKGGAGGSTHLSLSMAPVNDAFAAATDVGVDPVTRFGSNALATVEAGEPDHAGQSGGHSLWYRWTPAADTSITIDTCGSTPNLDSLLAVYTGDALDALTHVASDDDDATCGPRSSVTFDATAGVTYRIAVDGKAGSTGSVLLLFRLPPGNDRLADAYTTYGGEYFGSTSYAAREPGEPQHAGDAGAHSVWYRWTATKTGDTTVKTCSASTTFDTLLAVYTGADVGALTPVAANDDSEGCGGDGKRSRLVFHATAGTSYVIAVDGKAAASGTFALSLTPTPDNDDFTDAGSVDGAGTWTGWTENASGQAGEPQHAGQAGGRSVWYRWTADRSADIRVATCTAAIDTLLAVYTGTALTALTPVASSDDSGRCDSDSNGSAVTFTAAYGTTYLVAVDGKGGAQGTFRLQFDQPANDRFADAQTLTGRDATATANTRAASAEPGEPAHAEMPATASVWYRWVAPVDGAYTVSSCASTFDTRVAVYEGSSLAGLAAVASNDDGGSLCGLNPDASSVTFQATAGTEYRIAADGAHGSAGELTLELLGPPANDDFANATNLESQLELSEQERTTNASRQAGEPAHDGEAEGHSVWYRWTAPRTGETTIDTCQRSDFDVVLAVYTGSSLAALTPVASGDGCGLGRVTFTATAGTEYRIAVDGEAGESGRFGLHFEVPPANDAFAGAIALGSGIASVSSTNAHASVESGEPQHADVAGGRSVWYRWTTVSTGRVIVDSCGSSLDTLLAVYSGTSVSALTPLASNDDSLGCAPGAPGSRLVFDAQAGASYGIAVDGRAGATGTFTVRVTPVPANDDFENATALAMDATEAFADTRGASLQPSEPAHAGRGGLVSVWYRWTSPVTGMVRLDTCDWSRDTVLAVYTGTSLGALTAVAANDDACGSASSVTFEAVAGTIYRIAAATPATTPTAFEFGITLPPANDRLISATRVSSAAAIVQGTTVLAGRETGEPAHGGETASHSVWYRWTAPATDRVRISTCGSAFDTTLGVYTGTDVAALTPVASNDDSGRCGTGSGVAFDAVAGTDYAIAVDGSATGDVRLIVNSPANDDFEDAAELTGAAASGTSSTVAATAQSGEQAHWSSPSGSVWWTWTAPSSGTFAVGTCGSQYDTVLAVYRGTSLGTLTSLGGNDNGGGCGNGARVTFSAVAGTTYKFAVDQPSFAPRGTVVLTLNAPTNDLFISPTPVSGLNASVPAANAGASVESGEPEHAGDAGGASVWFTWIAPSSGRQRIATCGAGFDTLLGVYRGSALGTLTLVAASDDACGTASSVTFDAVAGTTYRIAVDGKHGATGTFMLTFERVSPPNDAFAAATPLTGAAPAVSQATSGATAEAGEPAHAGAPAAHSVWFRWTTPASGTVQIDTCGSDHDTRLAVYTGTALTGLTAVAASDDGDGCAASTTRSRVSFAAVAGRAYRIAVDGAGALVLRVNRPANDDRADAAPVSSTATGTTVGATREPGEPASGFATVWYRWPVPASGPVSVASTCPGGERTLLGVFDQGTLVNRMTASGCDTLSSTRARGTFEATAGNVYLIAVGLALDGAGGPFVLRVGVPANDDFADAAVLAGTQATVEASNVAASLETGEPLAGGASLWYAWTAPAGGSVTVDTCGSAIETLLGVYTGTAVDALTRIGASDCRVTFDAVQGTRYLIAVDGKAGAQGAVTLRLEANVDATAPGTTISSGPDGPTRETAAAFAFEADEAGARFECSLDGAPFESCTTPRSFTELGEGPHTFRVRAVDLAGNADQSPAERAFTVDRTPPQTEITSGPGAFVTEGSVAFAFASEAGATFECSFDGGSFAPCASPYERSGLPDRDYTFAVRAVDAAGNPDPSPATRAFSVDAAAPETTITAGPEHDIATSATSISFSASKTGVSFTCSLDGAPAEPCTSPHALTGLSDGPHRVSVTGTDRAGQTDPTPAERLFVVDTSPLTARAGDDRTVRTGEAVTFDGGASRPLGGIETYVWDFGDGATATGAGVAHAYAHPGDYTVKLTVTGPSGSATDTALVRAVAPAGSVAVTVRGDGGNALSGADVLVILPGGARVQAATGGDGVARIYGLADGAYTAFVQAPGHVPATADLTVDHGAGAAAVTLRPGAVAAATLSVHRMTLAEILAAGIDPNDPANQHVYSFKTRLSFGGADVIKDCFAGSGGWVKCLGSLAGVAGRAFFPDGDGPPTILWTVMDGSARFLKEFFSVDLVVQNLAPGGFTFTGGQATLNLPAGMSLAPTAAPQALTRSVPDVPGASSRGTTWIIRGDEEGDYDLSVDYRTTLAPFDTPIALRAQTAQPIHVWGASAIQLVIETDDEARELYPQTVRVGLKNLSDIPVYNASVELSGKAENGLLAQPRQRREFTTTKIAPGATFWAGPYVFVGHSSGELNLTRSFLRRVAGDEGVTGIITERPRDPALDATPKLTAVSAALGDQVALTWEPIPGATEYQLFRTANRETEFPSEPFLHTTGTTGFVNATDVSGDAGIAVSAVVDGKLRMHHPLLEGSGVREPRCDDPDRPHDGFLWVPPVTANCSALVTPQEVTWHAGSDAGPVTMTIKGQGFEPDCEIVPSGIVTKATCRLGRVPNHEAALEVMASDRLGVSIRRYTVRNPLNYVGLGDSYSAGTGLVPYFAADDEDNPNKGSGRKEDPKRCERSRQASAFSVKLPNSSETIAKDPEARMRFWACGGAVTANVIKTAQHGSEAGPQVDALNDDTDLVTLTIGGNDMKFAPIMQFCGMNWGADVDCQHQEYMQLESSGRVLTLDEYVNALFPQVGQDLLETFRKIREKAPNAAVMVADYPRLLAIDTPGACLEEKAFSQGERRWIADGVDRLSLLIEQKAAEAGIHFVFVSGAWRGHEKCGGGEDWSYGFEASGKRTGADDEHCTTHTIRVAGRDVSQTECRYNRSFHPNALGAKAYGDRYTTRLLQLAADPPNGRTPWGLPANPEPRSSRAASVRLRAAASDTPPLTPQELAEIRGFEASHASVRDLLDVQRVTPPPACGDTFEALPGQLLVISGDGFAPGTSATASVNVRGSTVAVPPTTVNENGTAVSSVVLPTDLGDYPHVAVTITGKAPSGFARRLDTVIASGGGATSCVAALKAAGLLSADGRALPTAADAGWAAENVTAVLPPTDPGPGDPDPDPGDGGEAKADPGGGATEQPAQPAPLAPAPPTPPAADRLAPRISALKAVTSRSAFRTLVSKRRLVARLKLSERATLAGELVVSARTAKRLKLKGTAVTYRRKRYVVIGKARAAGATGSARLTVKITKAVARKLRRQKRLALVLLVTAVDAAGNKSIASANVRLRR